MVAVLLPVAVHARPGTAPVAQSGHCPSSCKMLLSNELLGHLVAVPREWPIGGAEAAQFLQQRLRAVRSPGHRAVPPAGANVTWLAGLQSRNSSSGKEVTLRQHSDVQGPQRATGHKGAAVSVLMLLSQHSDVQRQQGAAAHKNGALSVLMVSAAGVIICASVVLLCAEPRRARTAEPAKVVSASLRPAQDGVKTPAEPASSVQSKGDSDVLLFGSRPATAPSVAGSCTWGSPKVGRAAEASPTASASPKPAGGGPASTKGIALEPVCRALVLPEHEAHLLIQLTALEKVAAEGGEFHIQGVQGNRLLRAEVSAAGASRKLDVFMVSATDSVPRNGRVLTLVGGATGNCEIQGEDGKQYGEILHTAGAFSVYCPGETQPVLVLSRDATGLHCMAKAGKDGPLLAFSSRTQTLGGTEQLELRTCPGVDNALVLACILSSFLFFRS